MRYPCKVSPSEISHVSRNDRFAALQVVMPSGVASRAKRRKYYGKLPAGVSKQIENGKWRMENCAGGGNKNAARMGGGGGCCTLLELFSSSGVLAIIAMGESFK